MKEFFKELFLYFIGFAIFLVIGGCVLTLQKIDDDRFKEKPEEYCKQYVNFSIGNVPAKCVKYVNQ